MTNPKTEALPIASERLGLKPCPICGGMDLALNYVIGDDDWHVQCNACRVQLFAESSKDQAVQKWNALRRPGVAALALVNRQIRCHQERFRRAQSPDPGWLDAKEEMGSIDALFLIRRYLTGQQRDVVVARAPTGMSKSTAIQSRNEKLINDYYCRKVTEA